MSARTILVRMAVCSPLLLASGAAVAQSGDCYADCDADGGLDFFDFLCFQNLFAAGDPLADCDESGGLDLFDLLCFQNEFAAGCAELTLVELGIDAPPAVICDETMTPFPADPRPYGLPVTDVPSPLGGQLGFSIPCLHEFIGFVWSPQWSHGYAGDVYWTIGHSNLDIAVPGSSVFSFYVQPNPFLLIEFEITGSAGGDDVSVIESIHGEAGARGYAFCGGVENVNVRTTDGVTDFIVGEFGIAN